MLPKKTLESPSPHIVLASVNNNTLFSMAVRKLNDILSFSPAVSSHEFGLLFWHHIQSKTLKQKKS